MRFLPSAPIVFCAFTTILTLTAPGQVKPRVAVFPFDDRTTANKDMSIGTKVADLLISKLTSNGAFTVFDRQYVDRILEESHRKYDPNYDSASTARAGLLGTVDLVVAGQIDAYSANTDESNTNVVFGQLRQVNGAVNLKVTARLISVEKGSITSAQIESSDQKGILCKEKTVGGAGTKNCTKNEDVELRRLVDKATDEVAKQLSEKISPIAINTQPVLSPIVAKSDVPGSSASPKSDRETLNAVFLGISDGLVYIDKGSADGVKVGDKLRPRSMRPSLPHSVVRTM